MGQYWTMTAHERREVLGWWGKAGAFIPSSAPASIIHRLAVPVVNNICDDSTTTSGFRNPSSGEANSNDLDGFSATTHVHSAIENANIHLNTGSLLLQLPNELLLLISNELDIDSLFTLTHCCRVLRTILRPEVRTRFLRSLAPWANTPLICAGDYMRSNPPRITTHIPKDFKLSLLMDPLVSDPPVDVDDDMNEEYSSMDVCRLMKHLNPTNVLEAKACLSPPTLNPHTPMGLTGRDPWVKILQYKKYFPAGRRWVLRNLTQKECVYVHILTSKHGYGGGVDEPDGEHALGFSLGTLIAVWTAWSDNPSSSMSGLDVRGRWAGDCFDIVVEDRLKEDIERGGMWEDVSYRAWDEMVEMFDLNHWYSE